MALPVIVNGNDSEIPIGLSYEDPDHTDAILSQLMKLFKQGQLCDATLIVGDHDTSVHRAVLASASSFFFDMFMKGLKPREDGTEEPEQDVFKLKHIPWDTFSYLLDFMYTGRLTVQDEDVAAVYKLAQELRIPRASEACAQYLIQSLTPDNCLGIRAFAADNSFREKVDVYINSNMEAVMNSKKFYGLNKVTLEIVGTDEDLVIRTSHENLLPEMLLWLRQKMASQKNKLDALLEDMIILYLNIDNQLTDCAEVEDTNLKENGLVQDYKKLKKQSGQVQPKGLSVPDQNGATSNYRKFSINPDKPIVEKEWSIIATLKAKERTYITIVMLNGSLVTLTVHYRPAASPDSGQDDPDSPVSEIIDRFAEFSPLSSMSTNRCAFGLKALKGKLFACVLKCGEAFQLAYGSSVVLPSCRFVPEKGHLGSSTTSGYDRGECLKSSEVYDTEKNEWQLVGEMKSPRGRFSIGQYQDKIYACGGSSGNSDVRMLECYEPETEKWTVVMQTPQAKASPGIAVLDGKLYVLGGCIGQSTVASCETYDLTTGEWEIIPNMNTQRYQIAVTVLNRKIYAIGGTNGWKCLNDVEVYDLKTKQWNFLPPMNVTRRGAGVDVYQGKIYVVGGNDGTAALNSMEIYDPETCTWYIGACLNSPRANCGVANLDGRMFAVGGFNGKTFLSTMEVLDLEGIDKWSCFLPDLQSKESESESSTNGNLQAENNNKMAAANSQIPTDLKSVPVEGTSVCNGNLKKEIKMNSERPS